MTIQTLAETEKREILRAVRETKSLTEAAKVLGIGRNTVYVKLRKYRAEERQNFLESVRSLLEQ